MQFFQEKLHFKYQALVVLKSLVLLMGRLVACSVRIAADKQTDRQTHRTTTVTLACMLRVNYANRAKNIDF